ncbi:hypothetical protein JYG34_12865 [Pseudomonas entomophila]|uniref:hypothetical protein n=1 Tax=Pseudomonas entomophila TaxID=312306 RepID=UPI001BD08D8D|nr:hypothetical protein [Pseudomonas entomophila]QVM93839.1 hypothetical protein JYG34_12865 [Pseudomonas entomophila]
MGFEEVRAQMMRRPEYAEFPEASEARELIPPAWTAPWGTIYMETSAPDYNVDGVLDIDKIRSTIIHESLHAASHNHVGFQGEGSEENLNHDEYVTDYYAKMVYEKLFPGAEYKAGYFTKDGGAVHWAGNLTKFMIESGHVSKDGLENAYFHTGEYRKLQGDLKSHWLRIATQVKGPWTY